MKLVIIMNINKANFLCSQRTEEMDELRLLHEGLQLSLNTLSKDPTQFSQQLTGRLSPHLLDMHCDR